MITNNWEEYVEGLTSEDLIQLIDDLDYNEKYYSVSLFEPYEYQKRFYKAGATHQRRFLMAANRINY